MNTFNTFTCGAPSLRGYYGAAGEARLRRLAPQLPRRNPKQLLVAKPTAASAALPYCTTGRRAVLARRREARARGGAGKGGAVTFAGLGAVTPPRRRQGSNDCPAPSPLPEGSSSEGEGEGEGEGAEGEESEEAEGGAMAACLSHEYDTAALSRWAMASLSSSSSRPVPRPRPASAPPSPSSPGGASAAAAAATAAAAAAASAAAAAAAPPSSSVSAQGARSMRRAQEECAHAAAREKLLLRKGALVLMRDRVTRTENAGRLRSMRAEEERRWEWAEVEREDERRHRRNAPFDTLFRSPLE